MCMNVCIYYAYKGRLETDVRNSRREVSVKSIFKKKEKKHSYTTTLGNRVQSGCFFHKADFFTMNEIFLFV